MDEATACLVLSLQLEDVETLIDRRKGKSKEGVFSDFEVALDLHREELRRNDSICSDRRMCRSIGLAVEDDGLLLVQERAAETRAFNDRQIACRLGGIRPQSLSVASEAGVEPVDEDLVAKLRSLNFSNESLGHESGDKSDLGESSSAAVECSVRTPNNNPPRRCVACTEVRGQADMMLAPCEHEYCRDCISDLFSAATTDESLFPPRCCNRHISLATVQSFLSPDLVRRFEERSVEFRTPNKTYCVSPTCSAFIPVTTTENDAATCPECGQLTCTVCKGPGHEGDCPENEPLQQVLQAASENGWQRCHSCKRLIELEIGCNHIVCVCRAEFCYLCGLRWKTCPCPQWNEGRLYARANQIVARDHRPNAQPVVQQVQEAVRNLRERHNCSHDLWGYVRGPHQCEECRHNLPQYIFECRRCRIQACNRCRRNRL